MPSDRIPELQVSVSQLKCYLKCPEQYRLRYVHGVEAKFIPVALAFGLALHKALAAFYGLVKVSGTAPELERVQQVFADAWAFASTGKVPLQDDEDDIASTQLDKGIAMLATFHRVATSVPLPQVDAVEHSFSVELFDPDTGETLEERLNGVIDLVLLEDGHRTVVEHKSSARKYTKDQLSFDLQPTAYYFAGQQLGWGDDIGLRYQVLTKTKVPALQVEDVVRDDQALDDFLRTAVGVLKAIDTGAFWPQRGWQCRGCPYSHACGRGSP